MDIKSSSATGQEPYQSINQSIFPYVNQPINKGKMVALKPSYEKQTVPGSK